MSICNTGIIKAPGPYRPGAYLFRSVLLCSEEHQSVFQCDAGYHADKRIGEACDNDYTGTYDRVFGECGFCVFREDRECSEHEQEARNSFRRNVLGKSRNRFSQEYRRYDSNKYQSCKHRMRCCRSTADDRLYRTAAKECACRVSQTGVYGDSVDICRFSGNTSRDGSVSDISAYLKCADSEDAADDMCINGQLQRYELFLTHIDLKQMILAACHFDFDKVCDVTYNNRDCDRPDEIVGCKINYKR